jgi:hypothetical protein
MLLLDVRLQVVQLQLLEVSLRQDNLANTVLKILSGLLCQVVLPTPVAFVRRKRELQQLYEAEVWQLSDVF